MRFRLPLWLPDEGEGWMLAFPNGLALHYGPEPRKREREWQRPVAE